MTAFHSLRRSALFFVLLSLVGAMLAACGGQPTGSATTDETTTGTSGTAETTATGGSSSKPGVLRMSIPAEPDTLDPQQVSFIDEIRWVMLNYQGLMSFDKDMNPVPGQAESVEVSDDGLTYTFTLRANSQYSDGSPLTAGDFEFGWKRLADPMAPGEYQFIGCGLIKGYSEYAATTCQGATVTEAEQLDLEALREGVGVKALDDTTLQVELAKPAPYFLDIAALWVGAPTRAQDAENPDALVGGLPENYVGNGPFMLVEHERDLRAVWEANPNYQGPLGPVKLQGIEMAVINDSQISFQGYQAGELDLVQLAPEDLAAAQADPALSKELLDEPGSGTFYMGFNHAVAPFDNQKVREAFAQAFDREAWVRDILQGLAKPSQTFIPEGFPGHNADETRWAFDPTKAQAALAEAGYPNAEGLPEIKLSYSSSPRNKTRFEWIANQLKQNLNIEVVLEPVDPTAYSALFNDPQTTPQLFFLGWSADYPDQSSYLPAVFRTGGSASSRIGWSSEEFDALVDQADIEQDAAKRDELYQQAQDILLDEVPVVFIYGDANKSLVKPYVKGIEVTPLDYFPGFFNLANIEVQ